MRRQFRRGINNDELPDTLGMVSRHQSGMAAPHGMANEHCWSKLERLDEPDDVAHERL
jgi:hypothetical protein